MTMQTDVKAKQLLATGAIYSDTTRLKSVVISYASGGTVVIRDGGPTGVTAFSFTAPAAAGSINVLLPGEGIKFNTDVHATLANATIVAFYG